MDFQLSDPLALTIIGVLVSLVWAQTGRFQDDKVSPLAKIALVLLTGVLLAVGFTLLKVGPPITRADWYALVVNSLVVAFSTQAFYLSFQKYLPGMSDLLKDLRTGQSAISVPSATTGVVGGTLSDVTFDMPTPGALGLSAASLKSPERVG
jgi:hypothetical protein